MLNPSCNSLNSVLKVKKKKKKNGCMVEGGCKGMGCLPLWSCGWLGAGAHCPGNSVISHSLAWERIKIPNLKCGSWSGCCFTTIIKLKNHKLNHYKSRTVQILEFCLPSYYIFYLFRSPNLSAHFISLILDSLTFVFSVFIF